MIFSWWLNSLSRKKSFYRAREIDFHALQAVYRFHPLIEVDPDGSPPSRSSCYCCPLQHSKNSCRLPSAVSLFYQVVSTFYWLYQWQVFHHYEHCLNPIALTTASWIIDVVSAHCHSQIFLGSLHCCSLWLLGTDCIGCFMILDSVIELIDLAASLVYHCCLTIGFRWFGILDFFFCCSGSNSWRHLAFLLDWIHLCFEFAISNGARDSCLHEEQCTLGLHFQRFGFTYQSQNLDYRDSILEWSPYWPL